MGLSWQFFNALDTKELYESYNSLSPYQIPFFASGDGDDVEYTLMRRNPNALLHEPWVRQLPGSYGLKMALYTANGATLLAFQDTWADDSQNLRKTGQLVQNSAAVTTALDGVLSVEAILEIEITTTTGRIITTYSRQVLLKKGLISTGTLSIPAGQVGATEKWVLQTFVPRERQQAGEQDIVYTPNGTKVLVYIGDDLQWHIEPQS